MKTRLLYRTIGSHLVVAVLPALVLGFVVMAVNREALTLDAEQLHLAVAEQMRTELVRAFDERQFVLDQAERILDSDEIPFAARTTMLRAIVASRKLPYLAVHGPEGKVDTVLSTDAAQVDRSDLALATRQRAAKGLAVGPVQEGRTVRLAVRWARDGDTMGYLVTQFDLTTLDAIAEALVARHLEEGEVVLVDGERRCLAASNAARVHRILDAHSPFARIEGFGAPDGLTTVELGRSMRYADAGGAVRLGTVLSAPTVGWVVGTSRPEAIALASIGAVKKRVLALAIVAALAAGLVGLLLARFLSEPVRRLALAVRASAQRGFFDPIRATGYREVGQLADAFNEVLGELARHRDEERATTNLRLRLSRYLPPSALHEVFAAELTSERGERAVVSVVYADLKGAEPLVDLVAQAHLLTMLSDFFAAACASIERYGGRIDRYSGDAVIGVFLAPDERGRARAALDAALAVARDAEAIAERYEAVLSASVGLVSGEGILSAAPESQQEISVAGDLVERAAALEREAAPGTVVMDPATRGLLASDVPISERASQTTAAQRVFVLNARDVSGMEGSS
ncbi:MAG: adenylate/guanylate cyclase domain-containing protein [Deltaproteobacteria bacterium]